MLTNIPIFFGVGSGIWITIEGRQKQLLVKTIIGGVVSLIANFILIPCFGLVGAAASTVLAQLTASIIINFFIDRKLLFLQAGIAYKDLK